MERGLGEMILECFTRPHRVGLPVDGETLRTRFYPIGPKIVGMEGNADECWCMRPRKQYKTLWIASLKTDEKRGVFLSVRLLQG